MAAYYRVEEEEVWKCQKHPSKRRRNGVCPTCLRDRLLTLCPNCGKVRPCPCASTSTSSSASSSSSSSDRAHNLTGGELPLRRSRSVAVPFLRSKNGGLKTPSFLSVLTRSKTKRSEPEKENSECPNGGESCNGENLESSNRIDDFARMITRSRSVGVGTAAMSSGFRRRDVSYSPMKRRFWRLPSPMKIFRSSRTPKVIVQDRSPLHI